MRRRDYLYGLGTIAGIVGIAGCSSSASEEPAAGPTAREQAGNAPDEPRTERTASGSGLSRTAHEPTASPTAQPTTTATPEPPANRLLLAPALGTGWGYVDGSAPRVRDNGTITALYRGTQPYARTLRTRLWPCEGQTLDALGGTCSLGSLPRRYRSRDDIETASPAIGETAFVWWSGPRTDIEVVAADHVFRMTHTPLAAQADESTASLPSRAARLTELIGFARQQAEKLASSG